MKKKQRSLKAIFEQAASEVRPLVRELLQIERDAEGLRRQWNAVPPRTAGIEKLFDPPEKSVEKRFRQTTGLPISENGVGPADCREILAALKVAFASLSINLDTDRLPQAGEIWTGNIMLYEQIAMPSAELLDFRGQIARYVLVDPNIKLNADGSLKSPLKKRYVIEDEE